MSCGRPKCAATGAAERGELGQRRRRAAAPRPRRLGVVRDPPPACAGPRPPRPGSLANRALLVEDVVVGRDQPGHHGLAQPGAGVDDDLAALAGDRVGREHHAGELGVDHPLDDDRHPCGCRLDLLAAAVGDGPLGPQRRPAAAYGVEHRVVADDVEVGVLLAGEGGAGKVLRGRAGADRDRPAAELGVRLGDRGATAPPGSRRCSNAGPDASRRRRRLPAPRRSPQPDRPASTAAVVRLGRDDKPVGDRETRPRPAHRGWRPCRRRGQVVAARRR